MKRRIVIMTLCWFALQAPQAPAILPPDAEFREPQLRAERIRMQEQYEAILQKRQAIAVREYKKAEAAVFLPPWERDRIQPDGSVRPLNEAERMAIEAVQKQEQRSRRLIISLAALLLIGGAVLVVRHVTKNAKD